MSGEEFLKSLPLVNSENPRTTFEVRGVRIGADTPVIIAGPCAVESEEQLLETAEFIKKCGGSGLRGGVFKPRSSPYSFQGMGLEGLQLLEDAREKTGLFTVVEITAISQIELAYDYADIFQIGARNMQNFELLKAVGTIDKPVLLKRGLSATVQELLQAAEYILKGGNSRVILCERGIRTFETMTRNTLDINAIALLKKLTHLPVFADPSHGTGRSDLVIPIAKAALSAGADGLIIEVHPNPEKALSDGQQSLNFNEFESLMKQIPVAKKTTLKTPKINPSFDDYRKLVISQEYNYIPISHEFVNDSETPVTAFLKLTQTSNRFLLESVERGEQVGRYSFIGWDPLVTIKAFGEQLEITDFAGNTLKKNGDPLQEAETIMKELKIPLTSEFGVFYGGAVGFIGYDYVRQIEKLPQKNLNDNEPDVCLMIPRFLARFDHVRHRINLIMLAKTDHQELEASYAKAQLEIEKILGKLQDSLQLPTIRENQVPQNNDRHFSVTKEEYMAMVERAKEYIFAGDVFQVVLSQRITQSFHGDPFQFYRLLRTINPSPYLFYLDFGSLQLAGSSPEVMVRRNDRTVTLKPIAGTKPRGNSSEADARLSVELLNDEKERAEHVMLVDLGRNDLGRVCKFGSVRVEDLMAVEYYSHVMHLVTTIHGELTEQCTNRDLFRAVFPAGTLSGAPKIRAMEIIEELEPARRGFYGGAVGYFGFNNSMDTCITIRTVFFKDNQATIQVGAGIVADSDPESEYQETMNKAGALLAALERLAE